ncbi:hypothetical protein LINGRAPRIM_LOCUS2554, partial [Linum grandiflorum]
YHYQRQESQHSDSQYLRLFLSHCLQIPPFPQLVQSINTCNPVFFICYLRLANTLNLS